MRLEVNGPSNVVMLIDAKMASNDPQMTPKLDVFLLQLRHEALRTIEYMKAVEAVSCPRWHEVNQ
jgi:hypothetical protein